MANRLRLPSLARQRGMSLVELMVSTLLGLILLGSLFTLFFSNTRTERVNTALANVQEDARFILSQLATELREAGMFDLFDPSLVNSPYDLIADADFITANPIVASGAYATIAPTVTNPVIANGASGASDTLVISRLATRDCRTWRHNYDTLSPATSGVHPVSNQPIPFPVINEYFVDNGNLRCRGYDLRALQGLETPVAETPVTLLENVASFQVLYGLALPGGNDRFTGQPAYYRTADQVADELANNDAEIVAVRLAITLASEDSAGITIQRPHKLMNEQAVTPGDQRLYRTFETSVVLRNNWNRITMVEAVR